VTGSWTESAKTTAGENRRRQWANAEITGKKKVTVSHPRHRRTDGGTLCMGLERLSFESVQQGGPAGSDFYD